MTAIGEVSRGVPDALVGEDVNSVLGQHQLLGSARRRTWQHLLVRPVVTESCQVSGRSDLSWDESARLDLSYVENWSMVSDVLIIGKTVKAVLTSDGAY
ncbi:hypothetical protein B9C99_11845 [Rhodococcus sp. BUPNP1]|nr:hypothetical protein B9C99_11845 [Rhodococcus sp. BUPNP1]